MRYDTIENHVEDLVAEKNEKPVPYQIFVSKRLRDAVIAEIGTDEYDGFRLVEFAPNKVT